MKGCSRGKVCVTSLRSQFCYSWMSTIIYCHLKATLQHCRVLPQTLPASVSGILAHLAPDLQFVEHLQLQSCVVTPVFIPHLFNPVARFSHVCGNKMWYFWRDVETNPAIFKMTHPCLLLYRHFYICSCVDGDIARHLGQILWLLVCETTRL